jgi:hypothetical protein
LAFHYVNRFCMALLYRRAGRLSAKNVGFRPGQCQLGAAELEALRLAALALLTGCGAEETRRGQASAGAAARRAEVRPSRVAAMARHLPRGCRHPGDGPNYGPTFGLSDRDFQPKYWAKSRNLGPTLCNFRERPTIAACQHNWTGRGVRKKSKLAQRLGQPQLFLIELYSHRNARANLCASLTPFSLGRRRWRGTSSARSGSPTCSWSSTCPPPARE